MSVIIDRIYDSLTGLFPKVGLRGRWGIFALVILILAVVVWLAESQIGPLYLWHLQRRVELLEQLNSLSNNGVTEKAELKPIYDELVRELQDRSYLSLSASVNRVGQSLLLFVSSNLTWRFIAGAMLGILVAISASRDLARGEEESRSTLYGGIFFAIVGGLVGLLIPIIISPIVHVVLVPIAMGALILAFAKLFGR